MAELEQGQYAGVAPAWNESGNAHTTTDYERILERVAFIVGVVLIVIGICDLIISVYQLIDWIRYDFSHDFPNQSSVLAYLLIAIFSATAAAVIGFLLLLVAKKGPRFGYPPDVLHSLLLLIGAYLISRGIASGANVAVSLSYALDYDYGMNIEYWTIGIGIPVIQVMAYLAGGWLLILLSRSRHNSTARTY